MSNALTAEELLDELRRLADELERVPTIEDMREHGQYSYSPYLREFGGWRTALDAANVAPEPPAGLTPKQFQTIRAVHDAGCYDVPRQATLDDIAAEFGVSHQALSERLQGAHKKLAEQAIEEFEEGIE